MTQDSRQQGSDPVGDFQRWLMRSGARGLGREVRGNLRKTFGYGDARRDDVWESATNEPEGGDPPECEWCPLCRAARKMRDSAPGLSSHLSTAGGIFATVVQDAVDAFEAAVATGPGAGPAAGAGASPDEQGAGPAAGAANPSAEPADAGADAEPADAGADAERADAVAGPPPGAADSGAGQQASTGEPPEGPARGPGDRS